MFRQFVLLCKQLDLFSRELLAVDGTRIKAVNNKDRNFTRASLNSTISRAARAMQGDAGGAGPDCREPDLVDRSRQRGMAARTQVAVGYNVQVAVDAKHKLIVEQQVTNQVVDMGLLTETAEPAKAILGIETIAVVADRGYFKAEDIEACEEAGMVRRLLSQGRVQVRRRDGQHGLSCRAASSAIHIISAARTEAARARLMEIADRCPAHETPRTRSRYVHALCPNE